MKLEDMSPEQQAVYRRIISGPRGHIGGPHWVWLRSPRFAELAQSLGQFCRFETRLEPILIEIAILITAAHWRAPLEWDLHVPVATRLGLGERDIEAIRLGFDPGFRDPTYQALYHFCRELVVSRKTDSDTYRALEQLIGPEAMVELVGILGYYSLISMTILAFEVPSIAARAVRTTDPQ